MSVAALAIRRIRTAIKSLLQLDVPQIMTFRLSLMSPRGFYPVMRHASITDGSVESLPSATNVREQVLPTYQSTVITMQPICKAYALSTISRVLMLLLSPSP